MIEINFTLGPAIVATILATAGTTAAFLTAIAAVIGAVVIFLGSPALRYFKLSDGGARHMLGPLTEPRLLVVFFATFGVTICFGFLEVGYPAYATALGMPAVAGALLSVNSLGSVIGGAIFGGLQLKTPMERQWAIVIALMAVPVGLHALVGTPIAFGIVAFLAGALIAPTIASQSVLVSRLAPAQYATEAFTWSSTFIVSGLGAGMALGGYLVEHASLRTMFVTGSLIVAAMALLTLAIAPRRAAGRAPASD
jgi:MFS family permease